MSVPCTRRPTMSLLLRRKMMFSSVPFPSPSFLFQRKFSVANERRPLSPHMTIYQPQLTWLMSIGHRVTGSGLGVLIYAFGISQSIPTSNSAVSLANMCEFVSAAPLPLVLMGKFVLAAPFAYHLFNGIRHLIWDMGRSLTLRGVYTTGWIVNVLTVASATLLTFY